MIEGWEEPKFNPNTGTYELRIKVKGDKETYTQIIEFMNLKSVQDYIKFIEIARGQRSR